jgi:hypothetical protein
MRIHRLAPYVGAALALLAGATAALAQSPADFFRGKTVSLLIGFGPGGEDDLWARTVARHMMTHIPGNPNVVPVHTPGSGGLLVANRLYNTAAKDGTVIGMINRGIVFEPLLGGQGAQFDAQDPLHRQPRSRHHGLRRPQRCSGAEPAGSLQQGARGRRHRLGSRYGHLPEFLSALLGMKFKLVKGYQGSERSSSRWRRNEVQGICLAYDSLSRGNLARNGTINVLLQAALTPDPRVRVPRW